MESKDIWKLIRPYTGTERVFHSVPIVVSNNLSARKLKFYIGSLPHSIYYFLDIYKNEYTYDISIGLSFASTNKETTDIIRSSIEGNIDYIINILKTKNPIHDYKLDNAQFLFKYEFKITKIEEYVNFLYELIEASIPFFTRRLTAELAIENSKDGYPVAVLTFCANEKIDLHTLIESNGAVIQNIKTIAQGNIYKVPLVSLFSTPDILKKSYLLLEQQNNLPVHIAVTNITEKKYHFFGKKFPNILKISINNRGFITIEIAKTKNLQISTAICVSDDYFSVQGHITMVSDKVKIESLSFGFDDQNLLSAANITQKYASNVLSFEASFFSKGDENSRRHISTHTPYPLMVEISENDFSYTGFVQNSDDCSLNQHKHFPKMPFSSVHSLQIFYDQLDRICVQLTEKKNIELTRTAYDKQYLKITSQINLKEVHAPDGQPLRYTLCFLNDGVCLEEDKEDIIENSTNLYKKVSYFDLDIIGKASTEASLLTNVYFPNVSPSITSTTFKAKKDLRSTDNKTYTLRVKSKKIVLQPFTKESTVLKIKKLVYTLLKIIRFAARRFYNPKFWIIGEDGGNRAEDNGILFFTWLRENKKSIKAYFTINADRIDELTKLKSVTSKILIKDSFKHLFVYCFAERSIGTHSLVDILPSFLKSKINTNKRRVFILSHGYSALKRIAYSPQSYNAKIRLFCVSSEWEKTLWKSSWGTHADYLKILGMIRYEKLHDVSKEQLPKTILYFPTWRNWYPDIGLDLLKSPAYVATINLLSNQALVTLLEKNNMILQYYPHPYFQKSLDVLQQSNNFSERVVFQKNSDKSVFQALCESSVLITDFSSIAFDFNFLQKNTIFYQFDFYEYAFFNGSYAHPDLQIFGHHAYTETQVINHLEHIISNDFSYNERDQILSQHLYPFKDNKCCERTFTAIRDSKL